EGCLELPQVSGLTIAGHVELMDEVERLLPMQLERQPIRRALPGGIAGVIYGPAEQLALALAEPRPKGRLYVTDRQTHDRAVVAQVSVDLFAIYAMVASG